MISRKALCLTIFAIAISGCSTTPHARLDAPPRPIFFQYEQAAWESLPDRLYKMAETMEGDPIGEVLIEAVEWILVAQINISSDDLACKRYMDRTESRIAIHNGDD